MKTALLYQHPEKGFRVVKSGFSWPAFFFMLFWAFLKKLYGFGLLMFFIWLAIVALYMMTILEAMEYPDTIYTILLLCYALVMGVLGNKYLSKDLLKKGYKHVKTVEAVSLKAALEDTKAPTQASN
jgi:uncharacterized sodium:solute symporter family permease YidK